MNLADCGKPEETPETKEHEDKSNNITIDISLIMGAMGGKPKEKEEEEDEEEEPSALDCLEEKEDCDDEDVDWKSIAKQLLQSVSMMDTHTDGVNSGTEDPENAIKAIDNETSRVLWGKQEESNPRSSYQNANYGQTTSNGLVMTNPAELCNEEVYGEKKNEHPEKPSKESKPPSFDEEDKHDKFDMDDDDKFDMDDDKDDSDDKYDTPDEPDDLFDNDRMKGKGFSPKKPQGFKQAAEGIIKKGQKDKPEKKPQDKANPFDKETNDKEKEVDPNAR